MPTYDGDGALLISLAGVVLDHEHSAPGDGGPLGVGVTDTDLTAGSVWFTGAGGLLQQDNANLFYDDGNDRLGVGTTTPSGKLNVHLLSAATNIPVQVAVIALESTGAAAAGFGPRLVFNAETDNPGEIDSVSTIGGIWEDPTSGNVDGALILETRENGGGFVERVRIASSGNVGVGIIAPGAQLSVDQSSGTGAKPVLTLDQADVDYVLAKIIATAAAASADRTLVADSDFGTPGALVGWIQIEIQDDGNRVADADYYIPFYAVPT